MSLKMKKKIMLKCFGFSLFYQCTWFFYSSCSYSPSKKTLMLENTSKERCLNYPLQILKCVLPIVFETLKSFNQNFCEGRSSILIEKAFSEAETKKVNGNILPNDTVLPSFPLSQY